MSTLLLMLKGQAREMHRAIQPLGFDLVAGSASMELRSSSEKYLNKALPANVSSAPNNDGLMKWLGLS